MIDRTVIYYTSNQEDEPFAQKIRNKLLATIGNLPLISVSQKPLPGFGTNICVGEVGVSGHNLFRQIQVGLEAATTPFVISAEADCLYPHAYFEFTPPDLDNVYRYDNLYILWKFYGQVRKKFRRKAHSEGAQIIGREHLLYAIRNALRDRPQWNRRIDHGSYVTRRIYHGNYRFFHGDIPVISVKTDKGLNGQRTGVENEPGLYELPFWGNIFDLRKELFS